MPIERDIDVALVARLAGMSPEEFQQLNPQLNKPLILAAGTPQVLLPYDNANRFIANHALHKGPLASWTAWVAPRNLSATEAARQLGIGEDELRELNHIPPRMLVRGGSTLLVPRRHTPRGPNNRRQRQMALATDRHRCAASFKRAQRHSVPRSLTYRVRFAVRGKGVSRRASRPARTSRDDAGQPGTAGLAGQRRKGASQDDAAGCGQKGRARSAKAAARWPEAQGSEGPR